MILGWRHFILPPRECRAGQHDVDRLHFDQTLTPQEQGELKESLLNDDRSGAIFWEEADWHLAIQETIGGGPPGKEPGGEIDVAIDRRQRLDGGTRHRARPAMILAGGEAATIRPTVESIAVLSGEAIEPVRPFGELAAQVRVANGLIARWTLDNEYTDGQPVRSRLRSLR